MPRPTTVRVAVVGLLVTAALTAAAFVARRNTERDLLEQRTSEAGAVLSSAISGVTAPLAAAAELAELTDEGGANPAFEQAMAPLVESSFASVAVWSVDPVERVLAVGEPIGHDDAGRQAVEGFLASPGVAEGLKVLNLLEQDPPRIGYSFNAVRDRPEERPPFAAYAEQVLPAERTAVVQPDAAFAGLDYAVYLSDTEDTEHLLFASSGELPLGGRRASERVPFGDTELLLVMSPTTALAGSLVRWFPLLALVAGLATTASSVVFTERLLRRRDEAERLAAENAVLYAEQRSVAQTLQLSLLPQSLPQLDGVEVAVRYEPGVQGMEVGGDWYDMVVVGERRLLALIGDVSGRGLRAAGSMASLRFAARALATQGDGPATILAKLNGIQDPDRGGHFATVLCAVVDLGAGTVTIANAGHPRPLLLDPGGDRFLDAPPGPPVGVVDGVVYEESTAAVGDRGTLLLFTDGLFERRDETVDDGMERLRESARRQQGSLTELVDGLVEDLKDGAGADDSAILAVRWGW